MKIVVAPDSFKECLSAGEVAVTLARALRKALPGSSVCEIPLADGGEGTVALLSGRVEDRDALLEAGFHQVVEVSPRDLPLQQAHQPLIQRICHP